MKTKQIQSNRHDQRKGFKVVTFASIEEHKKHDRKQNYEARKAHDQRLRDMTGKMRMSVHLETCHIPQIHDDFICRNDGSACALGAIQLGTMWGSKFDNEPRWSAICCDFDVYEPELDRNVKCPSKKCHHKNSLASMIHHLNDSHGWSFGQIGGWLRKYDL